MDINAIILELLSRIKALEEKVTTLEASVEEMRTQGAFADRPLFPVDRISSKYRTLAEYLYADWGITITLSYSELESILGFSLPDTANNFPKSFWANTRTHSYASSWLELGYKATVDYESKCVTFIRNAS